MYVCMYVYIYIGAIDAKEFFEAVEFYARVRKRVRRPVMLDLACGHGLVRLFPELRADVCRRQSDVC